jgi:RNA polymerase sigma-70 factor (ECF subfamily)
LTRNGANEVKRELTALLPRLWRFALYLTRDQQKAEDLVQSSCLRALEKASQYRAGTDLDRWVFAIAASIWKNALRSDSRTPSTSNNVEELPFRGVDTSEIKTFAQQVLRHVADLPDGQRAVVALICVEQWSYKEAAAALEIPIGTVMSRLSSARQALAPLIEEHNELSAEVPSS